MRLRSSAWLVILSLCWALGACSGLTGQEDGSVAPSIDAGEDAGPEDAGPPAAGQPADAGPPDAGPVRVLIASAKTAEEARRWLIEGASEGKGDFVTPFKNSSCRGSAHQGSSLRVSNRSFPTLWRVFAPARCAAKSA